MKIESKKNMFFLGVRIGIVFLIATIMITFIAYYSLSQNFHNYLTNYTIKFIQTMTDQGVKTIEYELELGKKEVSILASSFNAPISTEQIIEFPKSFNEIDYLRMSYTFKNKTITSDGKHRNIQNRQDILDALEGKTSIYGPYFDEENEYVISYSSPVWQDGNILGVLSLEKDGYSLSRLIENIQFADTGEAYIINAEGTDIAVSKWENINWVTSKYNSQKLYDKYGDEETKSILDLELKGLNGESGLGTYHWNNGLVYVNYAPIPSVNWVLLAGLREEELIAMTQSVLFNSISKGPTLLICFILFIFLAGLMIFWIISSIKKISEINKKLELLANHDSLTGLLNRRFLETTLLKLWKRSLKPSTQAAVFMLDIDDFKKYNDFFGHQKGDDCLCHLANIFKVFFDNYNSKLIRYGGEEFLGVIFSVDKENILELGQKICHSVEKENILNSQGGNVTVSIGICHVDTTEDVSLYECIKIADKALYTAKKNGKNRAVLL